MDPLQHVLTNVMCLDADSIAGFKHLEVTSIYDLLSISPRIDLQGEYPVSGGEENEIGYLSPITIRKVESVQLWFAAQPSHDVTKIDWPAFTLATFRQFTLALTVNHLTKEDDVPDKPISAPPPTPTASSNPSTSNRELVSFQRSIKCSPSDYNKFKEDSRWKQWNRHLKATANSHGLTDILDPTFVPTTAEDIELFKYQQKFMYSVFEQCLLTTKSKHIIHGMHRRSIRGSLMCMKTIFLHH